MNESDNLSKRLIETSKDLTKSNTGFSALLIFLSLCLLGVIFGLRYQPQPQYIIQQNVSVDDLDNQLPLETLDISEQESLKALIEQEDAEYVSLLREQQTEIEGYISSESNPVEMQPKDLASISIDDIEEYSSQRDLNNEKQKIHASDLTTLIDSKDQKDNSTELNDNLVVDVINNQLDERSKMTIKEETLVDNLIYQSQNGVLPEGTKELITNGHTQALIAEKSLEQSMEEYEGILESNPYLSVDEKNKIRNALSRSADKLIDEREDRKSKLIDLDNQLSSGTLGISEQERLKALIEQEDAEYAAALRKQQMELDLMVDEETTDQNLIKDSSGNNYLLQKYQAEKLAEDIEGLHDKLEEEQSIIIKPDDYIKNLLSQDSDRSNSELEIDESNLFLIDQLSEEISDDEKTALINKTSKEKTQRKVLNRKKELLLDQLASASRDDQRSTNNISISLVDKINNMEVGLDIANQKIDQILNILSTKNINQKTSVSELKKENKSMDQIFNDQDKENKSMDQIFNDQDKEKPEEEIIIDMFRENSKPEEIIEEPLYTFDQVSTKNKETLKNQIENEQKEFRNFKESGEMSESLRKKTIWFINRATYRPDPIYPRDAIKANIEGKCLVAFQINSNGKTEDTDATCTDEVFEASTEGTLSKYEFEPDEYIDPKVEVVYTLKGG